MNRPKVSIVDCETGEELVREMNDDEFNTYQNDLADKAEKDRIAKEEQSQKAALLAKLGITEDEAKLLLG